jgi:CRP/FNR family transcriptional regulator
MVVVPGGSDELFSDVPVLADLPYEDRAAIAEGVESRSAARGEALFREGMRAEGLMVVRSGEVKLVKGARDGREQILYLARAGRPIVEGVRFDAGAYPASAVAMRASSVALIPNQKLLELGQRRPQVLCALLDLRARRADRLLTLIGDLSLRTVPARLASFLCSLSSQRSARGHDGRTLVRDLTTETLAGRLGTVREEISRGLALLEREGALKVTPDVVVIEDLERLEAIAFGSRR